MAEGKLFINGVQQYDGDPIGVNGDLPIEKVICNGIVVWQNTIPPTVPIIDFNATDDLIGSVICTWSPSDGLPAPTYNLYENDILVASNIISPFSRVVSAGIRDYYVKAVNSAGEVISNIDSGASKSSADSITYLADGVFTVPAGYTEVTLCMIGGGGSGAAMTPSSGVASSGGGYAGDIFTGVFAVTPGANITVIVGNGGAGRRSADSNPYLVGNPGAQSKFGSKVVNGGAGGTISSSDKSAVYAGNGGSRVTCYTTALDGAERLWYDEYHHDYIDLTMFGGQAGFANGGAGNWYQSGGEGYGNPGALGSGGGSSGCSLNSGGTSGAGGKGLVKVSWS